MNKGKKTDRVSRVVVLAFGLSGAAALIYEVAWIRSLSHVLGSTTYAVSTMLSAFMAGLALGGYAGGRLCRRSGNAVLLFGLCELGIGVFGLLTIPAVNSISPVYFFLYNKYHLVPDMFFIMQFIICFAIMLVPTMLMGATFPIVSKIAAGSLEDVAVDVGRVYSINTLGAIFGSLAAGFFLIPLIGVKGTVQAAAWLNLAVGLTAVVCSKTGKAAVIGGMGIIAVTALNLATAQSEPRPYEYNFYIASRYENFWAFTDSSADYKLLFSRDDPHGTVRVYFRPRHNTLFVVNGGKHEGSTGSDMEDALMLAYFPLATSVRVKNVLGIGLGSGMTLRAVKNKVDDVDWVEINASMVTAVSRFFYPELMASGVNMIVDDARHYLQATDKKYDVIISQPSYPIIPEAGSLYTKEFFKTAAERLNPGGIMCQWFPYFEYSNDSIRIMIKTFTSVFPHTTIWRGILTGNLIFIGSETPHGRPLADVEKKFDEMNDYGILLRHTLYKSQPQVEDIARRTFKSTPYNTDDRPVLEFRGARSFIKPVEKKPGDRFRI